MTSFGRLSMLAYRLPPTWKAGETEVRFTVEGEAAVFTFRGTTFDGLDILRDVQTYPVAWDAVGGLRVHRGFKNGVDAIWPLIRPRLAVIQGPVVLNGHSKGGGEATLTAARLLHEGFPPERLRLVTQGCPLCGFGGLRDLLRGIPVERYVHGRDVVPWVPFFLPWRHPRPAIHFGTPGGPLTDHRVRNYL